MDILITAFEPFGASAVNATQRILALLPQRIAGCPVVRGQLPVLYGGAEQALGSLMEACRPGMVVCLGQAAGRTELSMERVAVNLCDAQAADNAGRMLREQPVVPGGPDGYMTRLPVTAMAAAARQAGAPAGVSLSAGTYLCNAVYYWLLHRERCCSGPAGGFIHVPALPEQAVEGPAMAAELAAAGITAAIGTAVTVICERLESSFKGDDAGKG